MARPPSSSRETARSAIRKLFTESEIAVAKSSVVLSRGASASISPAASRMSSSVMSPLTRLPYSSAERRPTKALPSVTSSAYSRSPPTGSPLASRVIRSPNSLSIRVR